MNIKNTIGFGLVAYVVIFIYWSIIAGFEFSATTWSWYVGFVVVAIVAHFLGAKLGEKNAPTILKYSVTWVIVVAILDALLSTRFVEGNLFAMWQTWVGYLLLLLVPLSTTWCKCKLCRAEEDKREGETMPPRTTS